MRGFTGLLHKIGLVTVACVLLSGCTAGQKPSKVETALAAAAKDVVIPIEARNVKNPTIATEQTVNQGKQLYQQNCTICHGSNGHGEASLGQAMYPPAMDLTSPHVQHWTDSEAYWIIQNGVRLTGMPSWKGLVSSEDTWKLAIFIRHLPEVNAAEAAGARKEEASRKTPSQMIAYGRTLYRQEGCFVCHRLDGEGGGVGPDLTVEGTRGRTPEWLQGHFKDPAKYTPGSIMPSFQNLTEEQLTALTAFLLNQKGHGAPQSGT